MLPEGLNGSQSLWCRFPFYLEMSSFHPHGQPSFMGLLEYS